MLQNQPLFVQNAVYEGNEQWIQPPNDGDDPLIEVGQLRVVKRQEGENLNYSIDCAVARIRKQVHGVQVAIVDDVLIEPHCYLLPMLALPFHLLKHLVKVVKNGAEYTAGRKIKQG